MITKARFDRSGRGWRAAFTLMELMVVLTIMVALVALSASAVVKFITVQQTTNTQSTLDRVQSQLARAWSKVKDDAYYKGTMNEPAYIPGTYPAVSANMTVGLWIQNTLTAGPAADPNYKERMKVIYTKLRLRQAFPMNFKEAFNPGPLPPLPAYVTYLVNHGIQDNASLTLTPIGPTESSVCLMMALQRGVSGAGIDPATLTAGGAAGDYNGMPYLNDAWARPIFFTRVPAGNLYLNPITAASVANPYTIPPTAFTMPTPLNVTCYSLPGANDPGDPQGILNSGGWGTAFGPAFSVLTLQFIASANAANQPTSYKMGPMLGSGGPSDWTKPGQALPFDPITFSAVPGQGALFSTP